MNYLQHQHFCQRELLFFVRKSIQTAIDTVVYKSYISVLDSVVPCVVLDS